jgi:hypothetical protein
MRADAGSGADGWLVVGMVTRTHQATCAFAPADLLSISASALVQGGDDPQREAKLWDCFAEVYDREVSWLAKGTAPWPAEPAVLGRD